MIELVSSTPVPRKPYDDAVAESFAALSSHILEMLAGGNPDGILGKVNALQAAIVDQHLDVQDPKGSLLQHIDISPQGTDVDYVNAILRGALKQMAALVAEGPGTERYCNARDELAAAIVGFNEHLVRLEEEKAKAKGQKTIADVRIAMTATARAYRAAGWLVERERDCSYRYRRTKDDPWSHWIKPYKPKQK